MVTLKELSKLLGVSISTVSKALNDAKDISKSTKIRVRELAEAMNYQPNKMGAALRNKKSKTIGVIIPDILNPFFAEVLFGIEKYSSKNGYDTLVCFSNDLREKEAEKIKLLKSGSVDGFLISLASQTQNCEDYSHITSQISSNKLVLFDRISNYIDCDKVSVNDEDITFKITKTLIEQGHKHIAFLSAIDNLKIGVDRKQGYRKALKENGLTFKKSLELCTSSNANMHAHLKKWILNSNIDSILAADNSSGIMANNFILSITPKKAKDIKIIGFSNSNNALLTYPKSNYIDQNAMKIGERAAELLIKRLQSTKKGESYSHIKIPPKFKF